MFNDVSSFVENFLESDLHKKRKLPIILFREQDVQEVKEMLTDRCINIVNVVHEKDVDIRCKHFPYTCEEVPFEHANLSYDSCDCNGRKRCKCTVESYRSYVEFSWENKYMKHVDNCYDDCCCISRCFDRYVVKIKNPFLDN